MSCLDSACIDVSDDHSDEDMVHSSDEEENEDDNSSISSKGDPEQPGESEVRNTVR